MPFISDFLGEVEIADEVKALYGRILQDFIGEERTVKRRRMKKANRKLARLEEP